MFLAIGALVTLERSGFAWSCRLGFLAVCLLVSRLVDFMRSIVKSFAISGEVRATKNVIETAAKINTSTRIPRVMVVNDIVYAGGKRDENVVCFGLF